MDVTLMTDRTALDTARAALARCWLGDPPPARAVDPVDSIGAEALRLGAIDLRPHQVDAVQQLAPLLDAHGGAVLADAVGLGKTYVALALAKTARCPRIVCPAGLRTMWEAAATLAAVPIAITTTESLSRSTGALAIDRRPDLVIVDEAHHCRNPYTHRYRALARLTAGVRVLLLTASPVHNR